MGIQNGDEPQVPGWAQVPLEHINAMLSQRVAGMAQELAMKDAYIEQLHMIIKQMTDQEMENLND
jgi:hypothetical protein